jgi:photosystem II stability/assembly factor-like uncharacterized protein
LTVRSHLVRAAALALIVLAPTTLVAQQRAAAAAAMTGPVDTALLAGIQWRSIGPASSGRSVAVVGSVARPNEYYIGTTGGGVWKTVDGGRAWNPVTDKYFGGTIGAVAISESNPDIVYVGGGETPIRGNLSHGDGVWKTTDAGKTWTYMGLGETEHIARVRIHPTNPDIVYVGALGHVWGPNAERGVFRSKDGGRTWSKILFRNDSTGITDLVMDPTNPNVLYAAFWQAGRKPWMLVSGGAGSGIFKTTDGGDNWTEITRNPGMPKGVIGNIGLAVSPANPNRLYAIVEADSGGVLRSDDAGATWQFMNDDRNMRQRAWYYTRIFADPKDANVVHVLNVSPFTSRDGGKTFGRGFGGGDNHDMWIAANDPRRMAVSHDNGVVITTDGGTTRVAPGTPTAQFYHVHLTNHFPYHVCGAEQDGSSQCGPSRGAGGGGRGGGGGGGGGGAADDGFYGVAGGESGYIASSPLDPDVTYGGNYGGDLSMRNRRTGQSMALDPWPLNPMGHDAKDSKYRFQWTFPIMNSPHDPKALYAAANVLFKSTDEGRNWRIISPDLTVNDSTTQGASGGPITKDQTSVEYYGTIFAIQESPLTPGLIWTGSDDGLIQVTRNGGTTWTNVTPKDLPKWTRISIVEPSHHAPGTMYFAANRFQMDDFAPYLYRTTNYGQSWTRINDGIPPREFTRVIREDPEKPGLLYAGTERGVWVSVNDGKSWQRLQLNLPPVPVHDLAIKDDDLVAATHGRSFWIIDDLEPLRQADPKILVADAHLYKPREAYRSGGYPGVELKYRLARAGEPVTFEFFDAAGKSIRKFSSTDRPAGGGGGRGGAPGAGAPAAGGPVPAAMQARLDSLIATGLSRDSATRVIAATVQAAGGGGGGGGGGGRGGFGGAARVTSNAGFNSYTWNLRYPDATSFQGMVLWGGGVGGPLAAPGTYTVKMTVGTRAPQTQSFVVKKDPRSAATDADLVAQHAFLIRINEQVTRANNAVRTIRNVKYQLNDRRGKLTGDAATSFGSIASPFADSLSAAEGEIYQVKNRSGQDPLNYPIKLNNQIAALAGFVSGGDRRPPAQATEVYNTLIPQLDREMARFKRAMDTQLPKVNAALKAAGQPEIVPSTDELGAPVPPAAVSAPPEGNEPWM